jgi:hypothetical protein
MSESSWKRALEGKIREDWGREIDVYDTQIELRKKGKIEEKLFAETRLRRGVYGQRYDNGQRHDGVMDDSDPAFFRMGHVDQHDLGHSNSLCQLLRRRRASAGRLAASIRRHVRSR